VAASQVAAAKLPVQGQPTITKGALGARLFHLLTRRLRCIKNGRILGLLFRRRGSSKFTCLEKNRNGGRGGTVKTNLGKVHSILTHAEPNGNGRLLTLDHNGGGICSAPPTPRLSLWVSRTGGFCYIGDCQFVSYGALIRRR
jgi:hypothetical protein